MGDSWAGELPYPRPTGGATRIWGPLGAHASAGYEAGAQHGGSVSTQNTCANCGVPVETETASRFRSWHYCSAGCAVAAEQVWTPLTPQGAQSAAEHGIVSGQLRLRHQETGERGRLVALRLEEGTWVAELLTPSGDLREAPAALLDVLRDDASRFLS